MRVQSSVEIASHSPGRGLLSDALGCRHIRLRSITLFICTSPGTLDGNALLTTRTLYLDESGDHDLRRIDPSYPVFVLGGVIVDDVYDRVIETELNNLKNSWFGTTNVILHTADIVRNKSVFGCFKDAVLRTRFFRELNELIADLDIEILACAIQKTMHRDQYGPQAWDPYMYALTVLVERFCLELGDVHGGGRIVAERRSKQLDRGFMHVWNNLQSRGTTYVTPGTIMHRISSCVLEHKSNNVAALQLADLVVSPIGRHLIKKANTGILDFYPTIYDKLIKDEDGNALGRGLVMIPKPQKRT